MGQRWHQVFVCLVPCLPIIVAWRSVQRERPMNADKGE